MLERTPTVSSFKAAEYQLKRHFTIFCFFAHVVVLEEHNREIRHGRLIRKADELCATKSKHSHWSTGNELQLWLTEKRKTNIWASLTAFPWNQPFQYIHIKKIKNSINNTVSWSNMRIYGLASMKTIIKHKISTTGCNVYIIIVICYGLSVADLRKRPEGAMAPPEGGNSN